MNIQWGWGGTVLGTALLLYFVTLTHQDTAQYDDTYYEEYNHFDKSSSSSVKVNDTEDYPGYLIEGDIRVLRDPEIAEAGDYNAVKEDKKWPRGIIPYEISPNFTKIQTEMIEKVMQQFHDKTCVRFIPKSKTDVNYIKIVCDSGCWSFAGMYGGAQPVSLGCLLEKMNKGRGKRTILHELMHAIGFWHEISRPDRDQYIEVRAANDPSIFHNHREGLSPGLKVSTSTFTFKTLLRHYAKPELTHIK